MLLLITLALAACALEFTLHVNSWVQHFVVYWLYNGLVLSAGACALPAAWRARVSVLPGY